jgi:hypothetical protein
MRHPDTLEWSAKAGKVLLAGGRRPLRLANALTDGSIK